MNPWCSRSSAILNRSASDMPLQTTKQERMILGILLALLVLGFLGILVL